MQSKPTWGTWSTRDNRKVIYLNQQYFIQKERLNRAMNDNSVVLNVKARVLYQTAEAIKMYCFCEDKEIWVPKSRLSGRMNFFSGQEVNVDVDEQWLRG